MKNFKSALLLSTLTISACYSADKAIVEFQSPLDMKKQEANLFSLLTKGGHEIKRKTVYQENKVQFPNLTLIKDADLTDSEKEDNVSNQDLFRKKQNNIKNIKDRIAKINSENQGLQNQLNPLKIKIEDLAKKLTTLTETRKTSKGNDVLKINEEIKSILEERKKQNLQATELETLCEYNESIINSLTRKQTELENWSNDKQNNLTELLKKFNEKIKTNKEKLAQLEIAFTQETDQEKLAQQDEEMKKLEKNIKKSEAKATEISLDIKYMNDKKERANLNITETRQKITSGLAYITSLFSWGNSKEASSEKEIKTSVETNNNNNNNNNEN